MAKGRRGQSTRAKTKNATLAALACVIAGVGVSPTQHVYAQNADGVAINLGVLDDLDPRTTMPRLLMPSAAPLTSGRIVLRPPPGVTAITPSQSQIILRPPPGVPNRAAATPRISLPKPAAPAAAPPTSVTSVPPTTEPTAVAPPPSAPEPVTPPLAAMSEAPSPATEMTEAAAPAMGPVVEAMSDPTPEPNIEPTTEQLSALPAEAARNEPVSVTFGPEEKELPISATSDLSPIAEQMNADDNLRVQLLGYASSADGSPSSIRRMSLSRALSVREFLMDAGVQSTRIEVRALGDQVEGGNPNRVDVVIEQR